MQPLRGLRVLEVDAIGPVPWCSRLLAGLGADVLRVGRDVGAMAQVDAMRAGRPFIAIDLKTDAGRAAFLTRVCDADVLMEGFRPGVMERLGVGPSECLSANPRLVYARVTGWGQDGPLAQRAGHDINYLALTGALHAIGPADGPPSIPLNIVGDYGGGGAFLAIGVLAAAFQARSGRGGVVDVAMIDGVANLMALQFSRLATGQWRDQRGVNTLDGGAPWYAVYETLDRKHVAVGAIEPQFYANFVDGLGLDVTTLPDRRQPDNWPALRELFAETFARRNRESWDEIFRDRDACVTPVLSMAEAVAHPHNVARGTFVPLEAGYQPATAPRF